MLKNVREEDKISTMYLFTENEVAKRKHCHRSHSILGHFEKGAYAKEIQPENGKAHESLWGRTGYAFMFFFTFLALAYAFGFLFLPEGIMKELPLPSLMVFEEKESLLSSFTKTLVYNLFMLGLIVGVNHFQLTFLHVLPR